MEKYGTELELPVFLIVESPLKHKFVDYKYFSERATIRISWFESRALVVLISWVPPPMPKLYQIIKKIDKTITIGYEK